MIFNGTAQELADLTRKHWDAEWWPKGLEYFDVVTWFPNNGGGWFTHDDSAHVQDTHAASIIFAAAFEFVSIQGLAVPLLWRDFKDENKWAAIIWGRLCEGPSPLHAILGAALEAAR